MKIIKSQENFFVLRFDFNEKFPNQEFLDFLKQEDIRGGYYAGLGNAQEITVGYVNIKKKKYFFKEFIGSLEIIHITGEVSVYESGEIKPHTHIVFADEEMNASGGHLKELTVGATLELFLYKTEPIFRKPDKRVGIEIFKED